MTSWWLTVSSKVSSASRARGSTTALSGASPAKALTASIDVHGHDDELDQIVGTVQEMRGAMAVDARQLR